MKGNLARMRLSGFVALLLAVALVGCSEGAESVGTPSSPCSRYITYHVDGTAKSTSITIQNAQGNTEQATKRSVPLTHAETGRPGLRIGPMQCGAFVYISAQNEGRSGTISCRISADGKTIEEASSVGGYTIATCSGTVPSG